ncbi:EAL domain-containing protein [Polaromonas sp.]|uniref:GGDEF/EAL domain-containing response regulator n=1 Tax=Polaromonas sp. TaxID=1869339 RepID=UPI001815F449|nr:EAL domain-containing protein [Polaromonas sp.]NMM06747.1 EAL domain-containing protein [Polaromonas sp.]
MTHFLHWTPRMSAMAWPGKRTGAAKPLPVAASQPTPKKAPSINDDRRSGLTGKGLLPKENKLSSSRINAISHDGILGQHCAGGVADALIMMVDDELLNIEMTQALLEQAGYRQFVSTHEPETAILTMRAKPPSVLLLDLSMPKVDGMEILDAMRADPVLCHIPVIVMTSTTDALVKLQALSKGAMDFLQKPVDPSELTLRIRNTLAATAYRDALAHHDPLTGLPNKLRYIQALRSGLAAAAADDYPGALLHVGIDDFSAIHDALGRVAVDHLLKRIGKRLANCVETEAEADGSLSNERGSPTLFRVDGGEFAIFIPCLYNVEMAAGFISKVLEAATTGFNSGGAQEILVTCSIGVAVFPDDGLDPDVLMINAELALRHARESGRQSYEFFSPDLNKRAVNKLSMGADLRRAFSRDELELLYQPRIDAVSGKLMGAESVVRWKPPSGRQLQGDSLLELAATSEMSLVMVDWVFDQILQQTRAWRAAGYGIVHLGVNVSLKQLPLAQLMESVRNAIKAGLRPEFLCLELHEASTLHSRQEEVESLVGLKQMGVRLALDHFGAGQSSLIHLRRYPIDEIKVDPLFFDKIEENKDNAAIVTAMIAMARSLGLTFVATGITATAQLAFLKAQQCDQCQGSLFDEPMGAGEFALKWLPHKARWLSFRG